MLFELSQICRALFRARAVTGAERVFLLHAGENIRAVDGVGCTDFLFVFAAFLGEAAIAIDVFLLGVFFQLAM